MLEIAPIFVLAALFVGWVTAEIHAKAGLRIVLGVLCMCAIGGAWINAAKRSTHLEAVHSACFREMNSLLDTGEVDVVKEAVSAYASWCGTGHPAHEALDILHP